jgi:hypothetical protein
VFRFEINGQAYRFDPMKLSSNDERDLLREVGWSIPEALSKLDNDSASVLAVQAMLFLARRSCGEPVQFDDCTVTFEDFTTLNVIVDDESSGVDDTPKALDTA